MNINNNKYFYALQNVKRKRKKIALQRIHVLFLQAEKKFAEKKFELSDRYVELARKISMKYLVRIPKEYRRKFCKRCYSYLIPGKNCQIRLTKHKVVKTCLKCGHIMRHPYLKEIKKRRENAGKN